MLISIVRKPCPIVRAVRTAMERAVAEFRIVLTQKINDYNIFKTWVEHSYSYIQSKYIYYKYILTLLYTKHIIGAITEH